MHGLRHRIERHAARAPAGRRPSFCACPGGMQPLFFLARPGGQRRRVAVVLGVVLARVGAVLVVEIRAGLDLFALALVGALLGLLSRCLSACFSAFCFLLLGVLVALAWPSSSLSLAKPGPAMKSDGDGQRQDAAGIEGIVHDGLQVETSAYSTVTLAAGEPTGSGRTEPRMAAGAEQSHASAAAPRRRPRLPTFSGAPAAGRCARRCGGT